MSAPTYDTGALLAAEAGDRRMWLLHSRALDRGLRPSVPATVLGQALRPPAPQVRLHRLLVGVDVEPFGAETARAVGRLLAAAGTADVVDAHVVQVALDRPGPVLTGDRADLTYLASSVGRRLAVIDI